MRRSTRIALTLGLTGLALAYLVWKVDLRTTLDVLVDADLDGITPLARDARDTHAMHLYAVRIDAEAAGGTRDAYQRELRDERISTSIHFLPVHRLTWFRERYPAQPPLPVAERAGDEVLSLPLSPAHSDDDIRDAIDAIRRVHARLA